MDKKYEILKAALKLAPFDGWTTKMLEDASVKAGFEPAYSKIAFPDGISELVDFFLRDLDEKMLESYNSHEPDKLKIRQRITLAIKCRLEAAKNHKQAIRKVLSFYAMPFNACHSAPSLWKTVDKIWYAAGDESTDFNHYTKRATLAAVYSSTLLYWLNDKSPDNQNTWEFLDRRIENIMQFNRLKSKFFK